MRNLFLTLVVVCALVITGIGGTLATWSDSETSFNNSISTGSLDLKVNGADDLPYGSGVPVKVDLECMIPQKWYGPYEVELWNAGQCKFASHAYIHLKRYECSNILPKVNPYPNGGSEYWAKNYGLDASTGYLAPDGSGLKPEPELVAEYGGKVDCTTVTGIGPEGDDCSMGSHVFMVATANNVAPNATGAVILYQDLIGKWLCKEIYMFDLMPCEPKTIYLWFWLKQDSEENYGLDFIPDPGETSYDLMHWKKFNDWPSWALMKDKVVFDLEFDLWLEDTPGAVVNP